MSSFTGDITLHSVEVLHVGHELSRPAGPPGVFNTRRQSLFVKIVADDDLVGWGETYALPGVHERLRLLAGLLEGRRLGSARALLGGRLDDAAGAPALAAIDIALHDLLGKAAGLPVHALLGGAVHEFVRGYASGFLYQQGLHASEVWPAEADRLSALGFTAMKVRIGGRPPREELPLLADLRERLPETLLAVDAWGAYSPASAIRVGRELEELEIAWFEEPCPPREDYAGYERVAAALSIPLAGGEGARTRREVERILDRGVLGVLQPDPAICGGLANASFAASLALLRGVACVPHTWNGGVMSAATLHLVSTIRGPGACDDLGPLLEVDTTENHLIRDVLGHPLELVDGCFAVPDAPGLGVEVDEPALRSYVL